MNLANSLSERLMCFSFVSSWFFFPFQAKHTRWPIPLSFLATNQPLPYDICHEELIQLGQDVKTSYYSWQQAQIYFYSSCNCLQPGWGQNPGPFALQEAELLQVSLHSTSADAALLSLPWEIQSNSVSKGNLAKISPSTHLTKGWGPYNISQLYFSIITIITFFSHYNGCKK